MLDTTLLQLAQSVSSTFDKNIVDLITYKMLQISYVESFEQQSEKDVLRHMDTELLLAYVCFALLMICFMLQGAVKARV